MLRTFVSAIALSLAVVPPVAQAQGTVPMLAENNLAALSEALMIPDVLEIMRAEGIEHGASLQDEMFPGVGGGRWSAAVEHIYDIGPMRTEFDDVFTAQLRDTPEVVDAAMEFFGSDLGQRILKLEVEARRALMDDATEDAAKLRVEEMIAARDPRLEALRDFAETNDLTEMNVAGALNSNLAFFRGMADAGAFGDQMTEEQMLQDVWAQEPAIRQETEDWLYPYLALAYGPLSDQELADYQAFSDSAAGQAINAALFAAFDRIFVRVSHDIGAAAAQQMQGQDI